MLANRIRNHIKKIIPWSRRFHSRIQGWYNICKSINVIQHINRIQDKNHIIISIDSKNAFNKIQHLFIIKAPKKLRIEGTFLNKLGVLYFIQKSVCTYQFGVLFRNMWPNQSVTHIFPVFFWKLYISPFYNYDINCFELIFVKGMRYRLCFLFHFLNVNI
jgi:hypothetical protein